MGSVRIYSLFFAKLSKVFAVWSVFSVCLVCVKPVAAEGASRLSSVGSVRNMEAKKCLIGFLTVCSFLSVCSFLTVCTCIAPVEANPSSPKVRPRARGECLCTHTFGVPVLPTAWTPQGNAI